MSLLGQYREQREAFSAQESHFFDLMPVFGGTEAAYLCCL
jgi:hypothetical protein